MQRQGKQAAQAQAQREEEITATESVELVKMLLRTALYHVSYLRGIFPDDHYRSVDMKNLDNIEVRMLTAKSPEATRMIQWVEGGVADALARRYLRKVFFGFSRDREGKDLLEEYVFSFSYGEDGEVHMVTTGGRRSRQKFDTKDSKLGKAPSLSQIKYQIVRLMRMLVEVTNTLEQVPDERFLFMKLTYTDDTPDEYEPPMFGPAPDGGVGCFSRMPFVMDIGAVDTKHLRVGLAVKSLLDSVEVWEHDNIPVADDNSHLFQPTTTVPSPTKRVDQDEIESMGGGFSCAGAAGNKGRSPAKGADEVAKKVTSPAAPLTAACIDEVKVWLCHRPLAQCHILDAMARFSHLPGFDVDACFAMLRRQGVLEPTDEPDTFRIIKAQLAQEPAPAPADEQAPGASAALLEAEEALDRLTMGLPSRQGGMHEAPGSERTQSVAGRRTAPAKSGSGMGTAQQLHFPDTQQASQAGGAKRTRKASFVEDPIPQGAHKRQRRAPAAAPAAMAEGSLRRSARHQH